MEEGKKVRLGGSFQPVKCSQVRAKEQGCNNCEHADCCKAVVHQPSVIPGRLEKQGENLNVCHLQLQGKPLKGLWRDVLFRLHSILDKVGEWSFWLGMVAQVCDLRPWKGRGKGLHTRGLIRLRGKLPHALFSLFRRVITLSFRAY